MSNDIEARPTVGQRIVDEAYRLATANPTFVYQRPNLDSAKCFYVHSWARGEVKGGCIFGQAALAIGLPIEEVREWDRREDGGIHDILLAEYEETNSLLLDAVSDAQAKQDAGDPWSVVAKILAPLVSPTVVATR